MRRVVIVSLVCIGGPISAACFGVGPLEPTTAEVQITPLGPVLTAIGAETQLTFTIGDGVQPANVVWRSNAPSVATVDSNGTVRAVGDGSATITAEADGMSASTTVTVSATISNFVQVRSQQTDPNSANNTVTVVVTVTAN